MLRVEKVRELTLDAPSTPDRRSHLSAASGLVRVGDRLFVVADDELHLGVFPFASAEPGRLIRLLEGELPSRKKHRKARKPDFEGLALLPRFRRFPGGALFALGSGSKPNRQTGVLVPLDPDAATSRIRRVDLSPMFDELRRELGGLNIEGVTVVGDQLWLLHRGNNRSRTNACVRYPLEQVLSSLGNDSNSIAARPVRIDPVDLGDVDGVPLCFTDGAALPDGSLVFTAVAEDTEDSYRDGPCRGAAAGIVDNEGRLRAVHPIDCQYKVEGVHAELRGDRIDVWMVTDADDADVPACLLKSTLGRA